VSNHNTVLNVNKMSVQEQKIVADRNQREMSKENMGHLNQNNNDDIGDNQDQDVITSRLNKNKK